MSTEFITERPNENNGNRIDTAISFYGKKLLDLDTKCSFCKLKWNKAWWINSESSFDDDLPGRDFTKTSNGQECFTAFAKKDLTIITHRTPPGHTDTGTISLTYILGAFG